MLICQQGTIQRRLHMNFRNDLIYTLCFQCSFYRATLYYELCFADDMLHVPAVCTKLSLLDRISYLQTTKTKGISFDVKPYTTLQDINI